MCNFFFIFSITTPKRPHRLSCANQLNWLYSKFVIATTSQPYNRFSLNFRVFCLVCSLYPIYLVIAKLLLNSWNFFCLYIIPKVNRYKKCNLLEIMTKKADAFQKEISIIAPFSSAKPIRWSNLDLQVLLNITLIIMSYSSCYILISVVTVAGHELQVNICTPEYNIDYNELK